MMHSNRTSHGAQAAGAAGEALDATSHALDTGRQFATQTASQIGEAARDLRESASDLARRSSESVSDATLAAQRQVRQYARATHRYVGREPAKSALVAAAIGAAAAVLVIGVLRSRRDSA